MAPTNPPRLGKYELVARIATGGMAEIFLARQPGPVGFSRLVVVKRILPHLAERGQFLHMFLEEARLASRIHHQNVVQIFDVGQHGESFFIAMEYVDGVSVGALSRRARKHGLLVPWAVACEVMVQACEGLHAAHDLTGDDGSPMGVVHRDVSPQNLMLSRAGELKLVDFGIAKARGSEVRTRTGAIKGKFPYMSPEQCRGEPLDRRSDLFSLASVFVEILVGKRVFERQSELMTLKAITEEPVPLAHELEPSVPARVSSVIARAHERDPADRYGSAAEMGADIRAALEELGEKTSKETVAAFLDAECRELLESREVSLSKLAEITDSMTSVPRLEGFDDATKGGDSEPTRPERILSGARGRWARRPVRLALAITAGVLVLAGATAGILGVLAPGRPSGTPLRFACPPYYPPETVREGLAPLVRYLETRLGLPVDLVVPDNYDSVVAMLVEGEVDFANLSPLLLVKTRRREPGIRILASHTYEGARTYQAILVARAGSGVTGVEDLEGRSFCYVDRASTSGYLLPRHFLRSRGLDPDAFFSTTRMSGTHVQVMQDIVAGRCDAGAIFSGALLSAQDVGVPTSQIQIVATAGETPWDVIAASPSMPDALAKRLRDVLLAFDPQRDLAKSFVSTTFRIDGFVPAGFEDFAPIEAEAEAEGLLGPGEPADREVSVDGGVSGLDARSSPPAASELVQSEAGSPDGQPEGAAEGASPEPRP